MTVIFNENKLEAPAESPVKRMNTVKEITAVECSRCKNKYCDRTRRGSFVKLFLGWLPLKRYFCSKCKRRFYKFS